MEMAWLPATPNYFSWHFAPSVFSNIYWCFVLVLITLLNVNKSWTEWHCIWEMYLSFYYKQYFLNEPLHDYIYFQLNITQRGWNLKSWFKKRDINKKEEYFKNIHTCIGTNIHIEHTAGVTNWRIAVLIRTQSRADPDPDLVLNLTQN